MNIKTESLEDGKNSNNFHLLMSWPQGQPHGHVTNAVTQGALLRRTSRLRLTVLGSLLNLRVHVSMSGGQWSVH